MSEWTYCNKVEYMGSPILKGPLPGKSFMHLFVQLFIYSYIFTLFFINSFFHHSFNCLIVHSFISFLSNHTCIFIHSILCSSIHPHYVLIVCFVFFQTRATSIKVTPQPNTWSEYRIMSVNEYGTSDYSNPTSPVYTMPARPTPPRDFRVVGQIRRKDKVSITLAWSKPLNLGIKLNLCNVICGVGLVVTCTSRCMFSKTCLRMAYN